MLVNKLLNTILISDRILALSHSEYDPKFIVGYQWLASSHWDRYDRVVCSDDSDAIVWDVNGRKLYTSIFFPAQVLKWFHVAHKNDVLPTQQDDQVWLCYSADC